MCVAALNLFMGTSSAAGGISTLFEIEFTKPEIDLLSFNTAMPFTVLLGIMLASTMKFMVEPRQLSRFYAIRDQ